MNNEKIRSADECFRLLIAHLKNGPSGRTWCDFALASEQRGFWLKLDWRGVRIETIQDAIWLGVASLKKWREECRPTTEECSLPTVTALLNKELVTESIEERIQEVRPDVLRAGMMVGVLHPSSRLRALTQSTESLPFRTNEVYLNVRFAVGKDTTFLGENEELLRLLARVVSPRSQHPIQ